MKIKKMLIIVGMAAFVVYPTKANAQDNKALRTDTWSIYVQGGASWASGLKFKSINPAAGTSVTPEVGFGVNYNLRPWVRLGLNYEFSKYRREQRLDKFESVNPSFDGTDLGLTENTANSGGIAYRKLWNMYHNVDLTAEFNIMELWPNRECTRFNLYAGTGVGMMFARGNTYVLGMGNEQWEDPNNAGGTTDSWVSHTWLTAGNSRHNYNSLYVPVVLSAEYDVMPQLTLGVKGQYKALFTSDNFAPDGLQAAAVTIRYNFVPSKSKLLRQQIADLNSQLDASRLDCDNEKIALQRKAQEDERQLKAQADDLKRQLAAMSNVAVAKESETCAIVFFENDKWNLSTEGTERLTQLAEQLKANPDMKILLVGSASAVGGAARNQKLSDNRLDVVKKNLLNQGIGNDRFYTEVSLGDTDMTSNADCRRVIIIAQ